MRTRLFVARLCCVQKAIAEVQIEAETSGDAYVIAERMAREGQISFAAADEQIDVHCYPTSESARSPKGKARP